MSLRALFGAKSRQFGSHFNGESLAGTKKAVANKAFGPAARGKYGLQQGLRETKLAHQAEANDRLAATKVLIRGGARKAVADDLTDRSRLLLGSTELSHFGLNSEKAIKLFNAATAKSIALPTSGTFASIARLLTQGADAKEGRMLAQRRLHAVVAEASEHSRHLGQAVFVLGTLLLDNSAVAATPNGRVKAFLPHAAVDEMEMSANAQSRAFRDATGRALESVGQSLAIGKGQFGVQVTRGNVLLARTGHELRNKAANGLGNVVAAGRPVLASASALAAAPLVLGAATVVTGAAVGAMGVVTGLGVGVAGAATGLAAGTAATAAAVSPLWAAGMVVKDGLTGGPGVMNRSRQVFKGEDVRDNLGLPSKAQIDGAKGALGRFAKGFARIAREGI